MTGYVGAVVTGIGMTTPVGLTAAQSCAAVRAGISAIAALDYFTVENDEFEQVPIMGCVVRGLTDGYLGLGRWTRLTTAALRDALGNAVLRPPDLAGAGLYVALPSPDRDGVDARITGALGDRIADWLSVPGVERRTRVFCAGHAGGALAFQHAVADLASGAITRAVICAVDSLVEPATLRFLLDKRRLKTGDRPDGFVPGEAAACVVLEPAHVAQARGRTPLATVEAASTATEPVTISMDAPSAATGLSEAIRLTFAQLPDEGRQTTVIVCDLNGETYRAKEFGTTAARVLSAISTRWSVWHPADCIGDTGAAAFGVSACVGLRALAKQYAKGDRVLVLGSSDDGLRGAVSFGRVGAEAGLWA